MKKKNGYLKSIIFTLFAEFPPCPTLLAFSSLSPPLFNSRLLGQCIVVGKLHGMKGKQASCWIIKGCLPSEKTWNFLWILSSGKFSPWLLCIGEIGTCSVYGGIRMWWFQPNIHKLQIMAGFAGASLPMWLEDAWNTRFIWIWWCIPTDWCLTSSSTKL